MASEPENDLQPEDERTQFEPVGAAELKCGSLDETGPIVRHPGARPPVPDTGFLPPYRIRVAAHIVRRSDGTGGATIEEIENAVRELNRIAWRDTDFIFIRVGPIDIINSNTFYDCPNRATIEQLKGVNHVSNAVNVYFTHSMIDETAGGSIVGIAHFATDPGKGNIVINASIRDPQLDMTLAHEIGHHFRLWHIDQGIECADGRNCTTGGDFLCGTPASPGLALNVTVDWLANYFGPTNGPCVNDAPYAPDVHNLMEANVFRWFQGYQFLPEQIQRMTETLLDFRSDLIDDGGDTFVDCNENGTDDIEELLAGAPDIDHDWRPDECSFGLSPGDLVVTNMVSGLFTPADGNATLFAPDGTPRNRPDYSSNWMHAARFGPDGMLYFVCGLGITPPHIARIDPFVNARDYPTGVFGIGPPGAGTFVDLLFAPGGDLLVLDNVQSVIHRFGGATGVYSGVFANLAASGITSPKYMEFGPDGNIYIVASGTLGGTIQVVDVVTGALLGSLIENNAGGLSSGQGLYFHVDGSLYVSNGTSNNVLRYDSATGEFLETFVPAGSGGLSNPHSLKFGPDGDLYVASRGDNTVKRYDGTNGAYVVDFATAADGLSQPAGLVFMPEEFKSCQPGSKADDCNMNGASDMCDIDSGKSLDCNGDAIPDECQLTGNDCNLNGVPDCCDIEPVGPIPDCNFDTILDDCQLVANDCNANDVPDECDVASGASADVNGNGVPDECEPCDDNGDCPNSAPCVFDLCAGSVCTIIVADRGDVAGANGVCGPDGIVDIRDIFAVIDAFQNLFAPPCVLTTLDLASQPNPCSGDDTIDILDIFAVIDAFQSIDPCCGRP